MKAGDVVVCINPDSRILTMLRAYTVEVAGPVGDHAFLVGLVGVSGEWMSTRFILLPSQQQNSHTLKQTSAGN